MTNEYLPPQQSWDLAPEGKGKYPAPGLKFHTKQTKFVSKVSHMHISTKSSYMRTKHWMEAQILYAVTLQDHMHLACDI